MYANIIRLTDDVKTCKVCVGDKEKTVANTRAAIKRTKNKSTFISLTAWDYNAEFLAKHFKKGDMLYIEGELDNDSLKIDDKTIQTVYITVSSIDFTYGNKRDNNDEIKV